MWKFALNAQVRRSFNGGHCTHCHHKCLAGTGDRATGGKQILHELEEETWNQMFRRTGSARNDNSDWTREVFKARLQRIYRIVCLCLEAGGLVATRSDLGKQWSSLVIGETRWLPEVDALYSEPLAVLRHIIDGLRLVATRGQSPIEMAHLQLLRDILEATPVLLRKRNITPHREQDIQEVMKDYLYASFIVDYVSCPSITGIIKNFKADAGVRSLKAAVEFKYAATEAELKTAVSGIFEDTAGYRGSLDWTRFFSVIYMTEPFESPARFRADMKRVGAVEWTPILVHGSDKSKKYKAKRRVAPTAQTPKAPLGKTGDA